MVYSRHQVARAHGRNRTADMKDAGSFRQLVFPIPGTNEVLHAWVKGTFGETWE